MSAQAALGRAGGRGPVSAQSAPGGAGNRGPVTAQGASGGAGGRGPASAQAPALAAVDRELAETAPLPRDNGELVFEEPWQGRALGMGVVALERSGASWPEFRGHLAAAVAARSPVQGESAATAYYACWLDALEALLAKRGLLSGPG